MARNRKKQPIEPPIPCFLDVSDSDIDRMAETAAMVAATEILNKRADELTETPALTMHPAQRFHQEVQSRIGKVNPNRVCPECNKSNFLATRGETQQDGSIIRERRCKDCGYVEDRIAPAEKPFGFIGEQC